MAVPGFNTLHGHKAQPFGNNLDLTGFTQLIFSDKRGEIDGFFRLITEIKMNFFTIRYLLPHPSSTSLLFARLDYNNLNKRLF